MYFRRYRVETAISFARLPLSKYSRISRRISVHHRACIHISLPANQTEDPVMSTNTVRTRLLIMSDTHTVSPLPSTDPTHAYRLPLPKADVLLHAGDITKVGYLVEYQAMFEMLKAAPAELKLVIPGNHDITLHEDFYVRGMGKNKHIRSMEDVQKIRELWTGYEARSAGIVYLEEGVRTFELGNGARFTVSGLHFHLRLLEVWSFGGIANWNSYDLLFKVHKGKEV